MSHRSPRPSNLYHPQWEHDACGIGAVVNISGRRDHAIIEHGKQVLLNLQHRGAAGADESTGDGAGMLVQIPHKFFVEETDRLGMTIPESGRYGVAMVFLPQDDEVRRRCEETLCQSIVDGGLEILGWREVPTDNGCLGDIARSAEPVVRQLFVGGRKMADEALERRLFVVRKRAEHRIRDRFGEAAEDFYVASMSCRTLVYKGMFLAPQLFDYYSDLADERVETALAIVHQRYSTNTFPSWSLAQPFRMIAHNGEINTLRGKLEPAAGLRKDDGLQEAGRRSFRPVSDSGARRKRLGLLRQHDGTLGPCRAIGPPLADDDDSRSVRRALPHQHRQAGVL